MGVEHGKSWYDRFVICDGIARIVLWNDRGEDPMSSVDIALQEKGVVMVAEYFFKHGFGNVDQERELYFGAQNSTLLGRAWAAAL